MSVFSRKLAVKTARPDGCCVGFLVPVFVVDKTTLLLAAKQSRSGAFRL
jgi:hypothetical protein